MLRGVLPQISINLSFLAPLSGPANGLRPTKDLTLLNSTRCFSSSALSLIHGQRKATGDKNFKTYKPITPGLRHLRLPRNDHLYRGRCHLPLTIPDKRTGGRNNTGRITVRHIGGGHKRRIRTVDFHRRTPGEQYVVRIEYDPGRSAHIALLRHQSTSELSYILAPDGLREGDMVQSFRSGIPRRLLESDSLDRPTPAQSSSTDKPKVISKTIPKEDLASAAEVATSPLALGLLRTLTIKPGNFLPLRLIPPGTSLHAVALRPDSKASLIRSAGTFGKLISLGHNPRGNSSGSAGSGDYAQVKLQSGEIRYIHMDACATIGVVSNGHWQGRKLGKAGRLRWLGRRPRVRGVAMNKVDHPLGGGRGKSKSNKHPVSPAGLKAKGLRTRRPGPRGNRMVVKQRPKGKHVGK
ncbi:uncharacterized protein MELLADRAFT_71374 [Melampsora larici-populina 98AG31]|uniref:Large ribosomal subunit protein uL2m n=1 Tax=Melampsora larici-populina (strain 98AG31 / pathotype 3-4-7) TaxID=747676 RepID=F4RFU1_MELLP|nr:uncharacterized protein MELLADRAFT_71374 [Melampsora larici-populina 98AG31]EGG08870.1 hypothetical protein MELLADRAFT_71374 [Melampsora larici-populina 98AG31]